MPDPVQDFEHGCNIFSVCTSCFCITWQVFIGSTSVVHLSCGRGSDLTSLRLVSGRPVWFPLAGIFYSELPNKSSIRKSALGEIIQH